MWTKDDEVSQRIISVLNQNVDRARSNNEDDIQGYLNQDIGGPSKSDNQNSRHRSYSNSMLNVSQ